MELLEQVFYGNSVRSWLTATGIAALAFAMLLLIKSLIIRSLNRFSKRTKNRIDDIVAGVLDQTKAAWLLVASCALASRYLEVGTNFRGMVRFAFVAATVIQVGFWGRAIIRGVINRHVDSQRESDPGAATTMAALGVVLQLLMWLVLALMGLENVGIEVGPLLAGLGVGGIAVALAVQNILGDLFASLSIVLDKPFVIGDFIVVGEMSGNVEHIGLKTTRVRSLGGEQLVFSNSDLLSTRIRNFKRMWERRIVFGVGVIYQTPRDTVETIPGMLKAAVEANDEVRFDRAHFKSFGPSSLDFEIVYYVKSPEFIAYMDAQQAINLAILNSFEAAGVEFAYPTQTLFIEAVGGDAAEADTGSESEAA